MAQLFTLRKAVSKITRSYGGMRPTSAEQCGTALLQNGNVTISLTNKLPFLTSPSERNHEVSIFIVPALAEKAKAPF